MTSLIELFRSAEGGSARNGVTYGHLGLEEPITTSESECLELRLVSRGRTSSTQREDCLYSRVMAITMAGQLHIHRSRDFSLWICHMQAPRTSIVFALSPRLLLAYRLHVSDFNVCSAWVYYQLQVTTPRLLLYSVATAELLVTFENGCDLGDRLTAAGHCIGFTFLMASFSALVSVEEEVVFANRKFLSILG